MITQSTATRHLTTRIHRQMVGAIDFSKASRLPEQEFQRQLQALAVHLCQQQATHLAPSEREALVCEILNEIQGYGPIEPLMSAPGVSEVLINGPDSVLIERNGLLESTNIRFADTEHLMDFIHRLVEQAGQRIDEARPLLDAKLPDGHRLHVMIPPLATRGPTVSLRRGQNPALVENDLLRSESLTPAMADFLIACVKARVNLLITGGTGSGKTTLLKHLCRSIPESERIVSIEQAAELHLPQNNVVAWETHTPNNGTHGEIGPCNLLQNAVRMRPDRIILGELRGGDAFDFLEAMHSGHDGSMSTIRAHDTHEALGRLERMIAQSGTVLPALLTRQSIASAVRILIHTARLSTGERRVTRISELRGCVDETYQIDDIFVYRHIGVDHDTGRPRGAFYATGYVPQVLTHLISRGLEMPLINFRAQELAGGRDSPCEPLHPAID